MYSPAVFIENRVELLYEFIRTQVFGTLVTCGADELEATHLPMLLHPEAGTQGVLRCHVARANPQWKTITAGTQALAIFQGANHYITPSWYPTKLEHGKVVPTWNYVAVHVRGRARLLNADELLEHVKALTEHNERPFERPWSVDDAPKEYVDSMLRAIVGIEIAIDSIEGKCKASQNQPERNQQGVISGLTELNSPESLRMAQLVRKRGLKVE